MSDEYAARWDNALAAAGAQKLPSGEWVLATAGPPPADEGVALCAALCKAGPAGAGSILRAATAPRRGLFNIGTSAAGGRQYSLVIRVSCFGVSVEFELVRADLPPAADGAIVGADSAATAPAAATDTTADV